MNKNSNAETPKKWPPLEWQIIKVKQTHIITSKPTSPKKLAHKEKKKNQSLIENSGQSINYYQNRIDYLLPEVAWELWAVSTLAEESRQLPIGYFLSLSYKTQYFLAILSNNTSWININPRKKRKKEAKKSEWSGSLHLKWMSTNTGKKKKKSRKREVKNADAEPKRALRRKHREKHNFCTIFYIG